MAAVGGFLLLVLVTLNPLVRFGSVVLGGLVVLGSSANLTGAELGYLSVVLIATGVALLNPRPASRTERVTIAASAIFGLFILLEGLLSVARGSSHLFVLRDAAAYMLFAATPVLARDAATTRVGVRPMKILLVVVGGVSAVSFALVWIARRSHEVGAEPPIQAAGLLPLALFAYSTSAALLEGRHRLRWAILASLTLGFMLSSGNRTVLVALLVPITQVLFHRGRRLRRLLAIPVLAALTVASAVLVTLSLARTTSLDPSVLVERLESLADPKAIAQDQSYRIRAAQTRLAWNTLKQNPVLGGGLGQVFVWGNPVTSETRVTIFALDSPLTYPAKFGLIGVGLLLAIVAAYRLLVKALVRQGLTVGRLAFAGYAVAGLAVMLGLGSVLEDKGFIIGWLLLLALALPQKNQAEDTIAAS
jgi:hypothetical protein